MPLPKADWPPRAKPAAVGLVAISGVVLIARLAIHNAELAVWTPNVVVGLVAVATTITLVDAILKREAAERTRERVSYVTDSMLGEFVTFCEAVAVEYAMYPGATAEIPHGAIEFLDLWLTLDPKPPSSYVRGEVPFVIHQALELDQHLQRHRAGDREVLHPDVVTAIDRYAQQVATSGVLLSLTAAEESDQAVITLLRARESAVYGASEFGKVLQRCAGRGDLGLDEGLRSNLNERLRSGSPGH